MVKKEEAERRREGGEAREEVNRGEQEDVDESGGANDSLMKAEAARQKASLVFRSARVLLRHRSHPLCVYTCVQGVSDQSYFLFNGRRCASLPTVENYRGLSSEEASYMEMPR